MLGNLDIIYLIYGSAFVFLALVCVALSYSDHRLPWRCLALFGLLHGINEWLDMLQFTSQRSGTSIILTRMLTVASFIALFEFGWISITQHTKYRKGPISPHICAVMALVFLTVPIAYLDVIVRYCLAFPASVVSAVGCFIAASRQPVTKGNSRIHLQLSGAILLAYAVVAGIIIAEPNPAKPALLLSSDQFLMLFHFPVQIVRTGCAVVLALILCHMAITAKSHDEPTILRSSDTLRFGLLALLITICGVMLVHRSNLVEQSRLSAVVHSRSHIIVNQLAPFRLNAKSQTVAANRPEIRLIRELLRSEPLFSAHQLSQLSTNGEWVVIASSGQSVTTRSSSAMVQSVTATSPSGDYRLVLTLDPAQVTMRAIIARQPTTTAISLTLLILMLLSAMAVTYRYERQSLSIAHAKLSLSESNFRSYVVQSPLGFGLVNSEYIIVQANKALCEILQLPNERIIGSHITEYIDDMDLAAVIPMMQQLRNNNSASFHVPKHYVCPDGQSKWLDCHVSLLYSDNTAAAQAMVQVMDISDRKHAEQAFATLMKTPIYGLYLVSPDGSVLFSNENGAEHVSHTTTSIVGHNIFEMVDADFVANYSLLRQQMLDTKQPQSLQDEYAGRIIDIEAYPILDDNGEVSSVVIFVQDVTELHRQRDLLVAEVEHSKQLQSIIDRSETVVLRISLKPVPHFLFVSNGITALGYDPSEMVKDTFDFHRFFPVAEFYRVWQNSTQHRKRNELRFTVEMSVLTADGEERQMEWLLQLFPGQEGSSDYVEAIGTDVTERRRLEQEHQKLLEQLHRAQKNESLALLAGGIAHDFNNLLLIVSGNAELALEDKTLTPETTDSLNEILSSSKRAARLSGLMLAYSGNIISSRIDSPVTEPLHRAIQEIEQEHPNANIQVTPTDIPVSNHIDTGQIQQVFTAVLENALEASPSPYVIFVDIELVHITEQDIASYQPIETAKAGTYVRVRVRDRGHGISGEHLAKVFDPFYSTKQIGRGLGLAAVFGIVKAHNGLIRIESEEGVGTDVSICLPA